MKRSRLFEDCRQVCDPRILRSACLTHPGAGLLRASRRNLNNYSIGHFGERLDVIFSLHLMVMWTGLLVGKLRIFGALDSTANL